MRKSVIKDIFYGERGHIESIHTQRKTGAYTNDMRGV